MASKVFREKSLDRISSPEEIDRYIRVTNPSVWIILTAIIVLLAGFCVWGIFGKLETTVSASGVVQNGQMTASIPYEKATLLDIGMNVNMNGTSVGTVSDISIGENGICTATISVSNLADGRYDLDIVTENINPIAFILS